MELNANIQLVMNSFWDTFPWQDFFPDMFQISWHFQVFQTSGHPVKKQKSLRIVINTQNLSSKTV